jgi:carboxypeptidase family protein/TonB-dependent receptor-like protein
MSGRPRVNRRFRSYAIRALLSAVALFAGIFINSAANAQVLYGSLTGTVTDPGNGVIPGAKVLATEMHKGIQQNAVTDGTGLYRFSELLPGLWKITVSAPGFNTAVTENILVDANNAVRVDKQLAVAAANSSITVTGAPPEMQTDRSDVHTDISSLELQSLPSVSSEGKNFQGLLRIIPGSTIPVESNSAGGNPARAMTVNVNGQSSQGNGTRIDGILDAYPWLPNNVAYIPSSDAIETVNIATNSYDAEQGGVNGAAVNVQIKSGTNKFHGAAHEFHTDDQLKALNFFTNPAPAAGTRVRPLQIFNQFGAAVGGPIKRDKLFFFGDYQGTRQVLSPAAISAQTLPIGNLTYSAAKTNGYYDFSGLTNKNGDAVVIYDPNTGNADGTGRTPFPNNRIPVSRVDPAALTMSSLIPAATNPTLTTNNYTSPFKGNFNTDQYDAKVNWVPSQQSTVFGHFTTQKGAIFDPPSLGPAGGNATNGGQPGNAATTIYIIGFGGTHAFTPNLLIDGDIGYTRQHLGALDTDTSLGAYGLDTLKIPGTNTTVGGTATDVDYFGIPSFQFSTFANLGNASTGNPFVFRDNQLVENENLTWVRGHHQFRFGGEWDHVGLNHFQPQGAAFQTARGTFGFNGTTTEPWTCTGGPPVSAEKCAVGTPTETAPSSTQYNSFADFLLGLPYEDGKATQLTDPIALRWSTWAFYGRDQWQVTPKLSVNLGLRWERYPMAYSDHDKGARVLDTTPGTPDFMEVVIGGYGSIPKNDGIQVGAGLFLPRIGVAYSVTPKTVVRLGGAMGADDNNWRYLRNDYPTVIISSLAGNNTGGAANYSTASPSDSLTGANATGPYAQLPAGIVAPAPVNLSTGLVPLPLTAGTSTIGSYPNFRRGYIYSYNLTVEQQFAGFVADLGYVGNRQIRPIENTALNSAPINGGLAGEQLNVAALAAGLITAGQSYSGISTLIPLGHTYYDSMQAKITRRIGHASQIGILYTWSKAEDFEDNEELSGISWPYPAYFAKNKARAGFDRKYNFESYWVYNLPFGKGQNMATHGIASYLAGGWTLSGVLSRLAGTPFTLTDSGAGSSALNDNGTNTQTVNLNGSFKITNGLPPWSTGACGTGATTCRYFDPSTVARVTTAAFGTQGRNWVVGPGYFDVDANLQRDFKIREHLTFQFEAQAIGLTNTPHFANPDGNYNDSTFGIISGELQGTNAAGLGGSQGERLWFFGGKFIF